jgi:hypothetical protein
VRSLAIVGNRGVNSIDRMTSTRPSAAATVRGPGHRGISFYHDMGLWAAKRHNLDLTIVLLNNNGGGIFHYLPQAAHDDIFEEWFGTPPDLDFAPVIGMYGGRHVVVEDWHSFAGAASRPPAGLTVLELRTAANTAMPPGMVRGSESGLGAATVAMTRPLAFPQRGCRGFGAAGMLLHGFTIVPGLGRFRISSNSSPPWRRYRQAWPPG